MHRDNFLPNGWSACILALTDTDAEYLIRPLHIIGFLRFFFCLLLFSTDALLNDIPQHVFQALDDCRKVHCNTNTNVT